jgi:hypothetical protein
VGWIVTVNTLTKIEPPPTEPVTAVQQAQVEAAA